MAIEPFSRYAEAHDGLDKRMPESQLSAFTSPRSVGELLGRLEAISNDPKERAMYPWADRFVMGYPLAPWQRQVVWTQDQMARFITSIWMNVDLGSYLVNDVVEYTELPSGELETHYLSDILLDGQQRLTALEQYVYNKFAVPDRDGKLCFWRDLGRVERRFFANRTFSMSRVQSWDEATLREVYNLRSFGGTHHTEAERA